MIILPLLIDVYIFNGGIFFLGSLITIKCLEYNQLESGSFATKVVLSWLIKLNISKRNISSDIT
jgi:hypothetical protein